MKGASPLRQRFPFGGLLLAAIFGILLGENLSSSWWVAMVAGGLILILAILVVKRSEALHGGMLTLGFTLGAFFLLHAWNWNEAPARALADWFENHPGEYEVRGIISEEPRITSSGGVTFPMRLERVERMALPGSAGEGTTMPVCVQVRWAGDPVSYGDRVSFHGVVERPEGPRNPGAMDYRRWLERHGIYNRFRVDPSSPGLIESHGHGNPLRARAITARHCMERILSADLEGAPRELGAIKGICLGVTDNTPEGFTDDFRFTGTMHLFSVSGLHVGMLAVLIWFFLKTVRVPRLWAVGLTIPALFFYVAVTGLKSGSIRSATMASILMIGLVLFRRAPLINTLAAAAFLQLAIETNTLFSAGWQFSYAVVFAILVGAPPIEARMRALHRPDPFLPEKLLTRRERVLFGWWNEFSGLVAVSAAAWVGSLIPTIAYFHLISFSAIGANLLAVPLAFGVLALGVLALLGGTFSLWVAGAFNNANWLVTKLLLLVVEGSALIPGGHWFVGPSGKPYPVMTILDLRGASCAVIRSGGEFAMIDAGRKRDALNTVIPFLESSGSNSIRNALITKADAAHLGGLPGMIHEVSVKRMGVPPSPGRSTVSKRFYADFPKADRLKAGGEEALAPRVTAVVLACAPGKDPDSVIVRVNLGDLKVLFLPKLEAAMIESISRIPDQDLKADLVILPLGGSDMAATLGVIRRIAPRAVISRVDALNRNGTPSSEWSGVLQQEGITLFRQDKTGAVVIEADPGAEKGVRVIPFLKSDEKPTNPHATDLR